MRRSSSPTLHRYTSSKVFRRLFGYVDARACGDHRGHGLLPEQQNACLGIDSTDHTLPIKQADDVVADARGPESMPPRTRISFVHYVDMRIQSVHLQLLGHSCRTLLP